LTNTPLLHNIPPDVLARLCERGVLMSDAKIYQKSEDRMRRITFALMTIVKHYDCVFVGDPSRCTPYALFATRGQAEIFAKETAKPVEWIMPFTEWWEKYGESPGASSVPEKSKINT